MCSPSIEVARLGERKKESHICVLVHALLIYVYSLSFPFISFPSYSFYAHLSKKTY
jgi:hypothetical protein